MLYSTLTIKGKELKLRLNANMAVQVEKQIGKNPINVLLGIQNNEMPKLNDLLVILWGSLQTLNSGYTMQKVWDLYDEYVADGNSMTDLIEVIMEVFKVSGFIKGDDDASTEEDNDEKNV